MRLRAEKYMKAKARKALVLLTRQRCMWVVVLTTECLVGTREMSTAKWERGKK